MVLAAWELHRAYVGMLQRHRSYMELLKLPLLRIPWCVDARIAGQMENLALKSTWTFLQGGL